VPKFLLPAGPEGIMLTYVLTQVLQVADGRVVVVLGREAGLARRAIECWLDGNPVHKDRVRICVNPDYASGQSSSLRAGLRALEGSYGVLVFLADMPGLDAERLEQLRVAIQAIKPSSLAVAPAEFGQARPPVYLTAGLFASIEQLTGDQGARALLRAHSRQVELLEWGSGPWFADVDTWEGYRELAHALGWARETCAPLPRETCPVSAVETLIEAALRSEIVPWLAPGLLLLTDSHQTCWLELPQSYRGVRAIVLGQTKTSEDRLELIRRATLAALKDENTGGGHRKSGV